MDKANYIAWFETLRMADVGRVGGKNASLGEMISQLAYAGVRVPNGFATTAQAYRDFLSHNCLTERIEIALAKLDASDVIKLAETGKIIRQWLLDAPFQPQLEQAIDSAYCKMEKKCGDGVTLAVRSSATAEDLPEASFAGQQETFLNIHGLENTKHAIKAVFASLYNDRAIAYRAHHGFENSMLALSAGVQRMVRSDIGASGVIFTLDTESGFQDVVFITASYGLGETVVQGAVNPDEFYVYKPGLSWGKQALVRRNLGSKAIMMIFSGAHETGNSVRTVEVPAQDRLRFSLNEAEVEELARYAVAIEKHYGRPMDIEWGRDGVDGKLYVLQARPETVKAHSSLTTQRRYVLKERSDVLISGRAIGQRIGSGAVKVILDANEMSRVDAGDVLVTDMTDPDWEPIMKRAAAIVTNRGGRTCHAAIIARELGIPAVVGCGNATKVLENGSTVTVSCAEGEEGNIYRGQLNFDVVEVALDKMPALPVKLMMNVGNPEMAFGFRNYPNAGIGLARIEFIISRMIGIHPRAILEFGKLPDDMQRVIAERTCAYGTPVDFYVGKLAEGVATLAAAFWPKPVIVRLSDFKSNEYANLIGGNFYEPHEENPMLGFRGAARYIAPEFRDCFELECRAIRKVREDMGFTNVEVMIPFVRTLEEAAKVVDLLAKNGLERGTNGLRLIMMCEIPSNVLLAQEFLEYFDGFSIGSNDLTQLTLGLDRDSSLVAGEFDERNPAVKSLLHQAIQTCLSRGKYVGICGQGPSDHPDLAQWLVAEGIESLSLNPDTVIDTWLLLASGNVTAVLNNPKLEQLDKK